MGSLLNTAVANDVSVHLQYYASCVTTCVAVLHTAIVTMTLCTFSKLTVGFFPFTKKCRPKEGG